MKRYIVFKIALSATVVSLIVMISFRVSVAQTSLDDIRKGYASAKLVNPIGETLVGEGKKMWTQSGLEIIFVIYKEDPNRFENPWIEIVLTMKDGTKIRTTGIETLNKGNFIYIISNGKVIWVPFHAIETVVVTKKPKKTFSVPESFEEVYGRFRFEWAKYTPVDFEQYVTVNLRFPLKDGKLVLEGWFLDGAGMVEYYSDSKWQKIPWNSVAKVEFNCSAENERTLKKSASIPSFVYRTRGDYSDVWKEYRFPKKVTKGGLDSPSGHVDPSTTPPN